MDQFFDETPELNITPLVDIMLVLLAVLMVTIPAVSYREDIALPQGSKVKQIKETAILEVQINQKQEIVMRGKKYSLASFGDDFLLFSQNLDKQTPVYISADKNLLYKDVIFILKVIKEAGFSKASLVTTG